MSHARELVLKFGWNAVAYQILNPGFSHWFSPEGDAVAGYVKRSGRWIIAGAPICDRDNLPQVIEQLETDARADGCRVCYFGAAVRLYDGCRHPPRHSVVALGAQPVWNPHRWNEIVSARASVRAQFNRARNKGVSTEEFAGASPEVIDEMQELLRLWIRSRSMPPMHFLVEPNTLNLLRDRRAFTARQRGNLVGFLIASPVPMRHGWLVEQIIRHPNAPNGTNELLLHAAMTCFAEEGCPYVTLGLVPLSRHGAVGGLKNPAWLAVLFKWLRAHGRRFYNFEGLEAFKQKFRPTEWEPIYAIATEKRFSPRTLWAITAAFSHRRSPIIHGGQALAMAVREEAGRFKKRLNQ